MPSEKLERLTLYDPQPLARDIAAFLLACQAKRLSPRTQRSYHDELRIWRDWLEGEHVASIEGISPELLRRWMIALGERRNGGGCHTNFRVVRAFLNWAWREYDVESPNPMDKVDAPKVSHELLDPLPLADLRALLDTCSSREYTDLRDRALLMALLDTGARASEFIALNVGDADVGDGSIAIRHGKGDKGRYVFLSDKSRLALLRYLRVRPTYSELSPLWATDEGDRLSMGGLRGILRRRAERANVNVPGPHSFRRAFALLSLRQGIDTISLQRIMGHSDQSVLQRYIKQDKVDLQIAHRRAGLLDRLL